MSVTPSGSTFRRTQVVARGVRGASGDALCDLAYPFNDSAVGRLQAVGSDTGGPLLPALTDAVPCGKRL
eukprot:11443014-Alexandrium_andersonii.AAC.1